MRDPGAKRRSHHHSHHRDALIRRGRAMAPADESVFDRTPVFTMGRHHACLAAVVAGQFRADSIAARTGIATAGWLSGIAGAQPSGRGRAARY